MNKQKEPAPGLVPFHAGRIKNCGLPGTQSPPLWGGCPRRGRERLRQNVAKLPGLRRIRTAASPLPSALRAATFPKGECMGAVSAGAINWSLSDWRGSALGSPRGRAKGAAVTERAFVPSPPPGGGTSPKGRGKCGAVQTVRQTPICGPMIRRKEDPSGSS